MADVLQRRVGEAPVKAQYLLPSFTQVEKKEVPDEGVDASEGKRKAEVIEEESNAVSVKSEEVDNKNEQENKNTEDKEREGKPPKKKRKGQNKARPRTVPKVLDGNKLCPQILLNKECQFKTSCRFSHDVDAFIKVKQPDIGDVCVNFMEKGVCRFGVGCRFSKQHTDEDNKNILDETKYEKFLENNPDNTPGRDAKMKVRKRQYHFPKTDKYLKSMGNEKKTVSTGQGAEDFVPCQEKKKIDFAGKLYLAPLTTVGNLPFRKICKKLGADITCGEMAFSSKLLQCSQAEWALIKRHESEDVFGAQISGAFPDTVSKVTELLNREANVDFIDLNLGCPIDIVCQKGEGSALMGRVNRLEKIVKGMVAVSDVPITVKMRTGIMEGNNTAHQVIPLLKEWGVDLVSLHGRTKEQRYTRDADWDYINDCAELASPMPVFGNGDVLSYEEANLRDKTSGIMIGRGALIKPWIFTEIKEQRHWDISSHERFELLKDFTNTGLMHWGSDDKGVENTRRFLLEWQSFLCRYIPVGLLEVVPQKINERVPRYCGRDDLETLFGSDDAADWVKISEMILGPVPDNFIFLPKHKANSYKN